MNMDHAVHTISKYVLLCLRRGLKIEIPLFYPFMAEKYNEPKLHGASFYTCISTRNFQHPQRKKKLIRPCSRCGPRLRPVSVAAHRRRRGGFRGRGAGRRKRRSPPNTCNDQAILNMNLINPIALFGTFK